MLVIGRKKKEGKNRIVIDARIEVMVVKLKDGVVRLRISSLGRRPIPMKKGERRIIGDSVFITILTLGPVNVGLGIEAPTEFGIRRGELGKKQP